MLQDYNYGSKLNFDVIKVDVALAKTIVHVVIDTMVFLSNILMRTKKLQRILLPFKVYFTFEPSSQP